MTITLMQEFDKLTNDIIVLGATNRIDRIDEALLRRFTVKHEVKKLNKEEGNALLTKYLKDVGMDDSFLARDIYELAEKSGNQSYILNELIRMIAKEIYEDLENQNE